MALIQDPAQRAVLDRVTAVMSLVEGHAEYVMDGVPDVVPTVRTLRKRFAQRRKGRGPLDRVMRRLLGLEQKMKQYAEGRVFVGGVIDLVGMEGFNRVWEAREPAADRGAHRPGSLGGAGAGPPGHPRLIRMVGPPRAVAVVRTAVRGPARVPAAGAGRVQRGADSVALAAALAFEARDAGVRVGGVTVDHALQPRSAERAEKTAALLRDLPLDPVLVLRVSVGTDGGPEGAARSARYDALAAAAEEHGARIALGHTLDDQAENAAGPRPRIGAAVGGQDGRGPPALLAAAARRPARDHRQACADQGLPVWDDPGTTIPPTRGCGCAPR